MIEASETAVNKVNAAKVVVDQCKAAVTAAKDTLTAAKDKLAQASAVVRESKKWKQGKKAVRPAPLNVRSPSLRSSR